MLVVSFDGRFWTRAVGRSVDMQHAVFAPDGKACIGSTEQGLMSVGVSGEPIWQLPHLANAFDLAVSASGKQIALVAKNKTTGFVGLQIASPPADAVEEISKAGRHPSWSADGTRLIYAEDGKLMMYELAKKTAVMWGDGSEPAWAPDGRAIAYRNAKGDFVLREIAREEASKLFSGKDVWTPLQWSPDGRYVMFVEEGMGPTDLGLNCLEPKKVMVYEMATKQRRFVHQLCKSAPYDFVWATSDVCLPQASDVEKKQ